MNVPHQGLLVWVHQPIPSLIEMRGMGDIYRGNIPFTVVETWGDFLEKGLLDIEDKVNRGAFLPSNDYEACTYDLGVEADVFAHLLPTHGVFGSGGADREVDYNDSGDRGGDAGTSRIASEYKKSHPIAYKAFRSEWTKLRARAARNRRG